MKFTRYIHFKQRPLEYFLQNMLSGEPEWHHLTIFGRTIIKKVDVDIPTLRVKMFKWLSARIPENMKEEGE